MSKWSQFLFLLRLIVRVVAAINYHGASRAKEIFKEAGVEFVLLNDKIETYKNM